MSFGTQKNYFLLLDEMPTID